LAAETGDPGAGNGIAAVGTRCREKKIEGTPEDIHDRCVLRSDIISQIEVKSQDPCLPELAIYRLSIDQGESRSERIPRGLLRG